MNLQNEMKQFIQLSVEQKKQCCLKILEWVKDKWGLFLELYSLIESGNADEKTLSDVYESAMVVLNNTEQSKVEEATHKLEVSKEYLKQILTQETNEHHQEIEDANKLLNF